MFKIITIDQLLKQLDNYNHKELHVHHTWKPEHKDFTGNNGIKLQESMRRYHVNTRGWSDIGQHVTLLPNGLFVTGRDFGKSPASITGKNKGAFACEMLGNFDTGHDVLEGAQKESILKLARYFDKKKRYIRFHREDSSKTCPGTGIDKDKFMKEVRETPSKPVEEKPNTQGVVTATVLNVREGAGTKYKVLGKLIKGAKVKIDKNKFKGDWWLVYCKNRNGFVHKNYVKVDSKPVEENPTVEGVVTASVLNVRAGAGTNYKVIGQLKKGDKVKINKENSKGSWWSISYGNRNGFVHNNYIKLV